MHQSGNVYHDLGLHQITVKRHFLQMMNACNSGESSQEWTGCQNFFKGSATAHLVTLVQKCAKMFRDTLPQVRSIFMFPKSSLAIFFDQSHLDKRIICNSLFFFTTWKNLEHHIDKVHVRLVQWYFTRKQGMVEWNSWTDLVV